MTAITWALVALNLFQLALNVLGWVVIVRGTRFLGARMDHLEKENVNAVKTLKEIIPS